MRPAYRRGAGGDPIAAVENKALARRILEEVWNKGNLAAIDQLYAPTYVDHAPANPGVQGRDGVRQLVTMYRRAFPDLQFTPQMAQSGA
jgi:hypothetical protein